MRRHSPFLPSHALLSVSLLSMAVLFACGSAVASESQQLAPDSNTCPDNTAASAERSEINDTDPVVTTPVRHTEKAKAAVTPRTSTRSAAPRWHSFLPGMFR